MSVALREGLDLDLGAREATALTFIDVEGEDEPLGRPLIGSCLAVLTALTYGAGDGVLDAFKVAGSCLGTFVV